MVINTLNRFVFDNEYKSLRCVLPWFFFFLIMAIIEYQYSYIFTKFDNKVSALEPSTMYLTKKNATPCLGDFVEFHNEEIKRFYYRKIAGLPGDTIEFYNRGYQVNGTSKEMGQVWVEKASNVTGKRTKLTVSTGKVFIVNTVFDIDHKLYAWPYALVPMKDIKKQLTYIIATKDFSKIGKYIGGDRSNCFN